MTYGDGDGGEVRGRYWWECAACAWNMARHSILSDKGPTHCQDATVDTISAATTIITAHHPAQQSSTIHIHPTINKAQP